MAGLLEGISPEILALVNGSSGGAMGLLAQRAGSGGDGTGLLAGGAPRTEATGLLGGGVVPSRKPGFFAESMDDPRYAANMALFAGMIRGDFAGGLLDHAKYMAEGEDRLARRQAGSLGLIKNAFELQKLSDNFGRNKRIRDGLSKIELEDAEPWRATKGSYDVAPPDTFGVPSMGGLPMFSEMGPNLGANEGTRRSPQVGGQQWPQLGAPSLTPPVARPVQYGGVSADSGAVAGSGAIAGQFQSPRGNYTQQLSQRLTRQAAVYSANGDFESANKLYESAAKFMPEVHKMEVMMQGGQPVNVITYKDGRQQVSPFGAKPDVHWLDTGGEVQPVNNLDMQRLGPAFKKTQTPDSAASVAATIRGQNMVDARARDNNPMIMAGGAGPGGGGGLRGDEFLQTLNPQAAAQVKALAEGRMQFPAGFALKSPYWQQMISAVSQYDPSFDAVNYNARANTRKDFTSGKAAQNLNAFNTVLGHLDSLVTAGEALNNTSYPLVNKAKNYGLEATGDARPKAFDANKKAVVDELVRAWRGVGGNETDIKSWSDVISNAASPEQLRGVSRQISDLLRSKIDAMGEQYSQGMGTTKSGIQLLTPHSQEVLKRIGGDGAAQSQAQGGAMDSLPAANGSNRGRTIRDNQTGKRYQSNGFKWEEVQ